MTNSRAYNFSAGPAALPEAVLQRAQAEMLDWQGSGMSVMEMSHRSDLYTGIAEQAEADLRKLLGINDDYHVLFVQGGASLQFSAIPLNLLGDKSSADYLDTGIWSKKAIQEAQRYGQVNVVASSKADNYFSVPERASWQCDSNAAYFHYTPNETIGGLEIHDIPDVGKVPLIADYSSTILSRPIDVSRFGLIYAGAQKNIGPAGLAILILRKDLLGRARADIPTTLNYQTSADNGSMYNTPPTYTWYLAGLVFNWLLEQGGLDAMAEINQRKAQALYQAIDQSDFYNNPIAPANRSWMNVPFTLADSSLEADFLAGAEQARLLNLQGHRSVGGMRASIYNAIPEAGVQALIDYMQSFERERA